MISGIYCITNTLDNKKYIGQSVNLKKRWNTHLWLLKSNKHFNIHLQRAYNLNPDKFVFEVLEYCDNSKLNDREIFYINKYGTMINGYNLCEGGNSTKGRICTEETKEKISKSKTGVKVKQEVIEKRTKTLKDRLNNDSEFRERFMHLVKKNLKGGWNKGVACSDKQKKLLSEANKGKVISEEHKNKLRELYKGENSLNVKLSENEVIKMRLRFLKGEKRMEIAKDFPSMHPNTIYDIVKGKRWKHLPNTIEELEDLLCN